MYPKTYKKDCIYTYESINTYINTYFVIYIYKFINI